jgi:hypothetical protein
MLKYHVLLYIPYFLSTELSISWTIASLTKTARRKVIYKHFLRAAIKTKLFPSSYIIHNLLHGQCQYRNKLQHMNSNMLLDHSHKLAHRPQYKHNIRPPPQEDKSRSRGSLLQLLNRMITNKKIDSSRSYLYI